MVFTDPVTILLSVILCSCMAYAFCAQKRRNYHNFPPGPKPLPLIGNMHIMDLKKPHKTLLKLSEQYGPIFSIQQGTQKMVVLCGYDTVKDALVNHAEEFSERARVPIFQDISNGHGIIFSHGENWKVMRRFTLLTLRDFGMGKKMIENKINEETEYLVQTFKSYGGNPFDNTTIINAAVANIILPIILAHRFDYEEPTFLRLMSLMNENIKLMGSPMVTVNYFSEAITV